MRPTSADPPRAAPRPVPARSCRAPAASGVAARGAHASRQIDRGDVRQSERFGDRRRDERGCRIGGQRHEDDAGCALRGDRACELERQARLADASGSNQRDEARRGISEPLPQRLHVGIAAEQSGQRERQRDGHSVRRCAWSAPVPVRSRQARHASHPSGRVPRTARAPFRHGAGVVARVRARSPHGRTGQRSSRALPA